MNLRKKYLYFSIVIAHLLITSRTQMCFFGFADNAAVVGSNPTETFFCSQREKGRALPQEGERGLRKATTIAN